MKRMIVALVFAFALAAAGSVVYAADCSGCLIDFGGECLGCII